MGVLADLFTEAQKIECPICKAAPGEPCTGVSPQGSHNGRLFASENVPSARKSQKAADDRTYHENTGKTYLTMAANVQRYDLRARAALAQKAADHLKAAERAER